MENSAEQHVYVDLEGGEYTIECMEKTIEFEQKKVKRADIIKKMLEDGSFHALFSIEARRHEVALATTYLADPMAKTRVEGILTFHAHVLRYFGGLIAEGEMAEATIESLEENIKQLMEG